MRTTISIADELLIAAKQRARDSGTTLDEIVTAALRRELNESDAQEGIPAVPIFRGGTGPRTGIDLTSNEALHAALDERR